MTRNLLPPLAACLLALGLQTAARAQDTQEGQETEQQIEELYKKLSLVLLGGRLDGNSMLILSNPGLPLSREFDGSEDDEQAILNQLVDTVPMPAPLFTPNGEAKYSDIYTQIIQNKQLLPNPPVPLTEDEKARRSAALALYDKSSPERKKYDACQEAYLDALTAQEQEQQGGKTASTRTTARVTQAMKDWIANGYKNQMDAAVQTIQQISAKDGGPWWQSLNDRMVAAQQGDGYHVSFFPAPSTWHSSTGDWTTITFTYGEKVDETRFRTEAIKASVGGSYRFLAGEGSFSKTDATLNKLFSNKDLSISFEVKRVAVYRKWLDYDVFRNTHWTLPPSVGGGVISYGTLLKNMQARTAMPMYVTTLFLARNLKIHTRLDKATLDTYTHDISAHAKAGLGVGLGPFLTVSGGYDKHDTGTRERTVVSEAGITCEGIQVLGYLATVVPKAPAASIK